jgi:hypothetical protein
MAEQQEENGRPRYAVPPRYGSGPITTALHLGPLASLAGTWQGTGFNVMWRPDNAASQPLGPPLPGQLSKAGETKRFLQLNLTSETLDFHVIPGAVPNRGLDLQEDLELHGLHYLQRVSDNDPKPYQNRGEALHIEPGLFMNVPASNNLDHDTIVRMGSIPHGVTVLMQGAKPPHRPEPGGPTIPPIYPIEGLPDFAPAAPPVPPPGTSPVVGLGIQPANLPVPPPPLGNEHLVPEVVIANDNSAAITEQSNSPTPPNVAGPGFPAQFQEYVNDPNQVLRDANDGLDILGTTTIHLSTQQVQKSIAQIPFLGIPSQEEQELQDSTVDPTDPSNAFVKSATATFWIEWVKIPDHQLHHRHFELHPPHGGDGRDPCYEIEPFLGDQTYLQLQYTQTVILVFNKVLWPHISVATLRLTAG